MGQAHFHPAGALKLLPPPVHWRTSPNDLTVRASGIGPHSPKLALMGLSVKLAALPWVRLASAGRLPFRLLRLRSKHRMLFAIPVLQLRTSQSVGTVPAGCRRLFALCRRIANGLMCPNLH